MSLLQNPARFFVFLIPVVFVSCVTMSDYNFGRIDRGLQQGNYLAVYEELENPDGLLYTSKDKVLENLDKGLLSHYAGEYRRSNTELSEAERLIRFYYSKSLTQAAASMVANDTVMDYAGDPYEDVYTNVFMALNYLQEDSFDDAFVEIRRFDNKLKEIRQKYQVQLENQKLSLKENAKSLPSVDVKFHNSALARYLSLLMYRTEGDMDSARVDYNMILEAFSLQPAVYGFPVPASINEELTAVPVGSGRLNVLAFSGFSPVKTEENIPLFAYDGFYKISVPVMTRRKSVVSGTSVTAVSRQTGEKYVFEGEKLESLEDIAIDTYSQKYAAIIGKTIARMVSKLVATAAFDATADNIDNTAVSIIFSLLGAASKVNMFLSERADVRVCRYFPASANIAAITLPEGSYDVTVTYRGGGRSTAGTQCFSNVQVSGKSLSLVESYCFK